MGSMTKKKVSIYVADADTDVNTLVEDDKLKGEIREYDIGGGDQEFETEDVFGGQVDVVNPREQFELELTLRPQLEYVGRFQELAMGFEEIDTEKVYAPAKEQTPKLFVIEATDGNGNAETWAFNKARNVTFNFNQDAEEAREGTVSFNISPENSEGTPNVAYMKTDVSEFKTWSAIADAFSG